MQRPYPLDLADAATGQLSRALNGLTGTTQRDNALMRGNISFTTRVLACRFGKLNTLALTFASRRVVVTGHL